MLRNLALSEDVRDPLKGETGRSDVRTLNWSFTALWRMDLRGARLERRNTLSRA